MTTPLYPDLAPLTFSWGFLRAGLAQTREAIHSWLLSINSQCAIADLDVPLDQALGQMQPLTHPPSKDLLVATQSDWTACFNNGANGPDLLSLMTVLAGRLKCCGVLIRCVTDKRMYSEHDQQDHCTHIGFEVFKPSTEPLVGPIRRVSVFQYYGKWMFTQSGDPLPGEDLTQYKANSIRRRLTLDSIDAFCQTLGLSPLTPEFYLARSCLVTRTGMADYVFSRSLVEAQAIFTLTSGRK